MYDFKLLKPHIRYLRSPYRGGNRNKKEYFASFRTHGWKFSAYVSGYHNTISPYQKYQ
jgi:hypothetical protein